MEIIISKKKKSILIAICLYINIIFFISLSYLSLSSKKKKIREILRLLKITKKKLKIKIILNAIRNNHFKCNIPTVGRLDDVCQPAARRPLT